MQLSSNMMLTIVFTILSIVNYYKDGDIPLSYQEGGSWTMALQIIVALLSYTSARLFYYTTQRCNPAIFALAG